MKVNTFMGTRGAEGCEFHGRVWGTFHKEAEGQPTEMRREGERTSCLDFIV